MNKLILIILVFAIFKNAGNLAMGCSLLPGGYPKCFSDPVYEMGMGDHTLREIKYRLDDEHIIGYEANPAGKDVRLGQKWEKKVGCKTDTVECSKYEEDDAYSSKYATYSYDYSLEEDRVIGKTDVIKLFLITKKEVWSCKNSLDTRNSIKFKRVVTELISREALGFIFFFDGIEVTPVPIPGRQVHDLEKTVIVREVKYIDSEDNYKVIRYDGLLKFKKPLYNKDEDSSGFKPVREDLSSSRFDFLLHREDIGDLHRNQKKYFSEVNANGGGINLEDIHRPSGLIGNILSRATCRIQEDDVRLNQVGYMPRWAKRELGPQGYRQEKVEFEAFLKEFVVTKHEIWLCTMEDGDKFERQVVEYIGKNPVETIDYFTGNKVWEYNMDLEAGRGDNKGVGVRATFYNGLNQVLQRRLYAGQLKLDLVFKDEKPKPKKRERCMRFIRSLVPSNGRLPEDLHLLKFNMDNDDVVLARKT